MKEYAACIILNLNLSNKKAQFVPREHRMNNDITPYVIN